MYKWPQHCLRPTNGLPLPPSSPRHHRRWQGSHLSWDGGAMDRRNAALGSTWEPSQIGLFFLGWFKELWCIIQEWHYLVYIWWWWPLGTSRKTPFSSGSQPPLQPGSNLKEIMPSTNATRGIRTKYLSRIASCTAYHPTYTAHVTLDGMLSFWTSLRRTFSPG